MPIELRILGALEVLAGGRPVALGGRKPRALVALLALHANELVQSDRLIEEIWPDSKPDAAARSLQVYVSRLRAALGDSAVALETRSGGYALALAADELDASRFERLLREGRRALVAGDLEGALATLMDALSIWRGPALADLVSERFAEREAARLEELRLEAIEERLEAELRLGRHDELISELETLVRTEPLRERLLEQLMLALYRSGRQADALDAYRTGRQALLSELGLEPSAELRGLQVAILRQDPALTVQPPELLARRHLPAPTTPLVGRRGEIEDIRALFREKDARLVTLTGPGGTGKTRLRCRRPGSSPTVFRTGSTSSVVDAFPPPEVGSTNGSGAAGSAAVHHAVTAGASSVNVAIPVRTAQSSETSACRACSVLPTYAQPVRLAAHAGS